MDGLLLIDKDKGFTSHDVVAKLRGILKTKKVGHSGTLDPEATGLLVVGVGKGTKIMKFLNQDEKMYQATAKIGETTDTLDDDGTIVSTKEVEEIPSNIQEVVESFLGEYTFEIPMYSAVKVQGKKLYEYAREGKTVDVDLSKTVEIYDIHLLKAPTLIDQTLLIDYQVRASKGLYVRALSQDIGQKLGYPAYNLHLRRLKAGKFDIKDAQTLEELKSAAPKFISLAEALPFRKVVASKLEYNDIKHGKPLSLDANEAILSLVNQEGQLLAIYERENESIYKPVNVFLEGETR